MGSVGGTAGGRQCDCGGTAGGRQWECEGTAGSRQWEYGGTARVSLHLVYASVHAVRRSFSCETLPLNLFLLQFGCLLVNPSTHQNSDRELLLGPEK